MHWHSYPSHLQGWHYPNQPNLCYGWYWMYQCIHPPSQRRCGQSQVFHSWFHILACHRNQFPNIVHCSARKLHCKSSCLGQSYNADLGMLCNHHKMYQRIYFINFHLDCLSNNDFSYFMNNWNNELVQFKLHLEVSFTKFKNCHIKWSPEVGFWLSPICGSKLVWTICFGPWPTC